MSEKNIIRTDLWGLYTCPIVGAFVLFISWMVMKEPDFLIVFGLIIFIFFVALPIRFAFLVKNDYIQTDSEGISIDVHGFGLFPKHHKCFYRWEDLSSYVLDARTPTARSVYHRFILELYGSQGQILENIKTFHSFDEGRLKLDVCIAKHSLGQVSPKPLHDIKKHGKAIFPAKKSSVELIFGVFLLLVSLIGLAAVLTVPFSEDNTSVFEVIIGSCYLVGLFILGGCILRRHFVAKRDLIIIDPYCIIADMHTTILSRLIKQSIGHDSYHDCSFSNDTLESYDKGGKKIFSCNCFHLKYAQYLVPVLRQFKQL